jgi:20S proteasome alpha/beta subunit
MTGLASDVEHLSRRLQRHEDAHWNIYDTPLTTFSLQQKVAGVLQQTAQRQGSRPFGVQLLIMGCDDLSKDKGACLFTIDPSGSWQSWGRATAIGKYAAQTRKQLSKQLAKQDKEQNENEDSSIALLKTLEDIVRAWKATCTEENVSRDVDEEYQALVLWRDEETSICRTAKVDDHVLQSILERVDGALVD